MGICVGIGDVFGYHMDYVAPLCVRVHSVFSACGSVWASGVGDDNTRTTTAVSRPDRPIPISTLPIFGQAAPLTIYQSSSRTTPRSTPVKNVKSWFALAAARLKLRSAGVLSSVVHGNPTTCTLHCFMVV